MSLDRISSQYKFCFTEESSVKVLPLVQLIMSFNVQVKIHWRVPSQNLYGDLYGCEGSPYNELKDKLFHFFELAIRLHEVNRRSVPW